MYVKAAVALHNYLRTEESAVYFPSEFIDGKDRNGNHIDGRWRADSYPCSGLEPVSCAGINRLVLIIFPLMMFKLNICNNICRYSRSAASMHDAYKDHFTSSIGEVSWQYSHIRRT